MAGVDAGRYHFRQFLLQSLHNGVTGVQRGFLLLTLRLRIVQLLDVNTEGAGTDDPLQAEV